MWWWRNISLALLGKNLISYTHFIKKNKISDFPNLKTVREIAKGKFLNSLYKNGKLIQKLIQVTWHRCDQELLSPLCKEIMKVDRTSKTSSHLWKWTRWSETEKFKARNHMKKFNLTSMQIMINWRKRLCFIY